ncbi:MAG: hypothetical protein ACRD6X_18500, partial [Pyrinomonadaceae bacterium]
MRPAFLYAHLKRFRTVFAATFCAMLLMLIAGNAIGQAANLSLADLLIALRSKKATLEERNSILSEAVSKRGVTFTLTPQIEKELESAGAGKELLDSIRNKAAIVKIASVVPSLPEPAAKPEVKPPDAAFYEKRGAENASNDKIDPAIDDYSKAIEMNPTAMSAYVGRAEAYSRKELWALSLSDLSKVLEAAPE